MAQKSGVLCSSDTLIGTFLHPNLNPKDTALFLVSSRHLRVMGVCHHGPTTTMMSLRSSPAVRPELVEAASWLPVLYEVCPPEEESHMAKAVHRKTKVRRLQTHSSPQLWLDSSIAARALPGMCPKTGSEKVVNAHTDAHVHRYRVLTEFV